MERRTATRTRAGQPARVRRGRSRGVRQALLAASLCRRGLQRPDHVRSASQGDLASAEALNRELHSAFLEEAIFRIDHFLGKEPVQNIVYFRFANSMFEPM